MRSEWLANPNIQAGLAEFNVLRPVLEAERVNSQKSRGSNRWLSVVVLGLVSVSVMASNIVRIPADNAGFTFDVDCKMGKYNRNRQYPQVTITNEGYQGEFVIDYGDGKLADFFVPEGRNPWTGMFKRSYERVDGSYEEGPKTIRVIKNAMYNQRDAYFGKVIASYTISGKC